MLLLNIKVGVTSFGGLMRANCSRDRADFAFFVTSDDGSNVA